MRIGKDQLATLNAIARDGFHNRLITFLRKEIPEEVASMDDVALRDHIIASEKRAEPHGIQSEAGITQFVCLTFLAGTKFDEIPEVKAFLETPEGAMTAEEKLKHLIDQLQADRG